MSEQLELSPLTTDDLDFMIHLVNDPKTIEYLPGLIQDRETMLQWMNTIDENDREFIVRVNGRPIGNCNIDCAGDTAELGIVLLPEIWRRGYGTEIVGRLIQMARDMGIREMIAITDSRNQAMIHVLEKTGFKVEKQGMLLRIPEDEGEDAEMEGQPIARYAKQLSDTQKQD